MAAPAGTAAATVPATPHVVGNAFVNQYYNVLHQQPENVYKFYTDASWLTRAEGGPNGSGETVSTQQKIHDKVMSLDYGDVKAEIKSVDSQTSLSGGVLVMVTGSLSNKADGKRSFVQSFFLAPQEKGYYVLNDIFRYLDEEPQLIKHAIPNNLANGVDELPAGHELAEQASVEVPEAEHVVHEVIVDEHSEELIEADVSEAVEQVKIPEAEGEVEEFGGQEVEGEAPVLELAQEEPQEEVLAPAVQGEILQEQLPAMEPTSMPAAPQEEYSGERPKMSYASILTTRRQAASAATQQAQALPALARPIEAVRPIAVPAVADSITPVEPPVEPLVQAPPPTPSAAAPTQESSEEASAVEVEGDGRFVFVRNLPITITPQELAEEFKQFGPVKMNQIQIKGKQQANAQSCYGFVEFEEAASAQAAIQKSPIIINGMSVRMEEKKPMSVTKGYRGRGGPGVRGGDRPYRSDNGRGGRSQGYGGGRQGGRGPMGPERERDGQQNRGRTSGPPMRPGSGGSGGPLGPSGFAGPAPGGGPAGEGPRRTGGMDGMGGGGSRGPRRGGGPGHQGPRGGAPRGLGGAPPATAE